ncbi:NACHT, LRR and PYD domains-containing protein 3 [Danio rerio]|uniref:NACHT, LRR and PYD domains-containing protein 3 n=1 Tax=Danio rerio TaxID=7955 RepID=F1QBA5_DANRE|nr:NACHT, LRR and PYD domains-containing protein 12 [Danio rerio]|eukprot:XP_005156549.1 NACHT, LRR and PYD domains-containing protein 12 [Danio rerio]
MDNRKHEDEDLPGDTFPHRRNPAEPSSVSVKSHQSMDPPNTFRSNPAEPSSVSVKSHQSMDPPNTFRSNPAEPSSVSVKSHQSMDPPNTFRSNPAEPSGVSMKTGQRTRKHWNSHVKIYKSFKTNMLKKCQCLSEATVMQGNTTLLNEIYTELYITEGDSGEVNTEHEVRQIEAQSRSTAPKDTAIKCRDIFIPLPGQHKPIRTMLMKGVAGIGKTVSVQKFIVDWAEGKENQDIQFIFPLPFREINLMKDKILSLADLLHLFFPETKEMEIPIDRYKVLFIFDGLDECRLSLDFKSNVRLHNVSESASMDVLLMNLIAGNLLLSALIWITSRPAAADLIPSEFVHRLTEVRGFNDPQKEEYFRKKIRDQSLANKIISHLKSTRSLFIMCHIPVFCWISASVLEQMMRSRKGEIPRTLTEMYTQFLIIQTNIKHKKHYEKTVEDEEIILKLGKLAFLQLVKGNLIFYEEDLRECGIDVAEASVYSGLCTQIFREELGWYQGRVFCFVHLSIQEHLAALHVLLSFSLYKRDVLNENLRSTHARKFTCHTISDLHQRAVDKALQSKNGHLDLFLRFLLGLSLESNQMLLKGLLTNLGNISFSEEKSTEYIKTRIRMNPSPEKSINLFHCLNELGDPSLVKEVQQYVRSGCLLNTRLSSSQWSAVVFVLVNSEQLDSFDLSKYISREKHENVMTPDEVLQKLVPVVEASRSARLSKCDISDEGCAVLSSALSSHSSNLRELNLTEIYVGDSRVKLLFAALKDPHCKLEKLMLFNCGISNEGSADLASALRSNLNLRELDLSGNKLRDSGVKLLSDGLKDCKLEILRLCYCGISDEGCAALALALRSASSNLRELDLIGNRLGDSGVKLLSAGLKNPHCKLEALRLKNCGITNKGCDALASALRSVSTANLRELDLCDNRLRDSGVRLLSARLEDPHCKLEKLRLCNCEIEDCADLASTLKLNSSNLRELDLTGNKLGDSGVKLLSDGLKDAHCKLEKLRLIKCGITDEGCTALASALRSPSSNLRELDLTGNNVGDSGGKLLSDVKDDPNCKLETLCTYN